MRKRREPCARSPAHFRLRNGSPAKAALNPGRWPSLPLSQPLRRLRRQSEPAAGVTAGAIGRSAAARLAPSTGLRPVPLPRFAGEEMGRDRSLRRPHCTLIFREQICVFDRAVMMDLPPAAVEKLKDSSGANVQVFDFAAVPVGSAFSADRPEDVAKAMKSVVPKLDMDVRRAFEQSLVHLVRRV